VHGQRVPACEMSPRGAFGRFVRLVMAAAKCAAAPARACALMALRCAWLSMVSLTPARALLWAPVTAYGSVLQLVLNCNAT
jgi:hypothetical protein